MRRFLPSFAFIITVLVLAILPARAEELWKTLPAPLPLPPASETGDAPVNGITIHYAVWGDGSPLLLLHGGLGNMEYFGGQVAELAKQYQVIAMDSRGHGQSTRNAEPYSYALMAKDVIGLMDHLQIDKASIVGWSDGGIIGLDIAMNYPDRLDRLFAFGANTNVSGLKPDIDKNPTFAKYIENAGKDYERLSKTPKEYNDFLTQIGQMWATQPNYTPEQLAKITAPVAIADGEHDEAIRQEHNVEMSKAIPGARLVILPGVSHFAMLQDPKAFTQAVLEFLK
ncbi:alpha/beta fold hydrolase [Taklimakanibacter lacteus]|uniref:alpha/beta fold hydrolase n=1 Tax=Taklimakanibacter lacteus TaxID=2268456 RepID=UPI000E65F326